jgi:hypothetical protein
VRRGRGRRRAAFEARAHERLARVARQVLVARIGVARGHFFLLRHRLRGRGGRRRIGLRTGAHVSLVLVALEALVVRGRRAVAELLLLRRFCVGGERRCGAERRGEGQGGKCGDEGFHRDLRGGRAGFGPGWNKFTPSHWRQRSRDATMQVGNRCKVPYVILEGLLREFTYFADTS